MSAISDEEWLAANLAPAEGRARLGISIPGLPPPEIQERFTGASGLPNLRQAFDFYKLVLRYMPGESIGRYRLVDFGGGWGRITRFFLRECAGDRLLLLDCLSDAVECARSLSPPFAVVHTDVRPPLPIGQNVADCCIAFSVFSHLSESACETWLAHLRELLVPHGTLIVTTRGTRHIESLFHLHRQAVGRHIRRLFGGAADEEVPQLVKLLPHPRDIERRYANHEFQFYPTGGGGELTTDFYGETWIPEAWMAQRFRALGFSRCEFLREIGTVDQCVFVLTR